MAEFGDSPEHALAGVKAFEDYVQRHPKTASALGELALAHRLAGWTLGYGGDFTAGIQHGEKALELDERAIALSREPAAARMELAGDLQLIANFERASGRLQAARQNMERSLTLRREVYASNSADAWVQFSLLVAYSQIEFVLEAIGDTTAEQKISREAVDLVPKLMAAKSYAKSDLVLGWIYATEGLLLQTEGKASEACRYFELARANYASTDARGEKLPVGDDRRRREALKQLAQCAAERVN